jgi:hypothetical protein
MILLFTVSVSLMVKFVSLSPILDSSVKDHTVAFRKSACYSTLEDQNAMFHIMTSIPKYKSWQRPGLNADGSNPAPLQVKHL